MQKLTVIPPVNKNASERNATNNAGFPAYVLALVISSLV